MRDMIGPAALLKRCSALLFNSFLLASTFGTRYSLLSLGLRLYGWTSAFSWADHTTLLGFAKSNTDFHPRPQGWIDVTIRTPKLG